MTEEILTETQKSRLDDDNDDGAEHCRRYGAQDVTHVVRWALRGRNPFERSL